jgi:hypothetical protein
MLLALTLQMAIATGAASAQSDLDIPPWAMSREETKVPDGETLPACERAVQEVVALTGAEVLRRQYSKSSKWGTILRAEVTASPGDPSSGFTVMCWGSNAGVQMWMNFLKSRKVEK